ncbi:MAG TPA: hypothetical protein ENL16_02275 [Candidatus Woesearchaeota archaeon]|nr:hypothetical protein [Candidatus Woesearchaeota archaeon]
MRLLIRISGGLRRGRLNCFLFWVLSCDNKLSATQRYAIKGGWFFEGFKYYYTITLFLVIKKGIKDSVLSCT